MYAIGQWVFIAVQDSLVYFLDIFRKVNLHSNCCLVKDYTLRNTGQHQRWQDFLQGGAHTYKQCYRVL